MSSAAGSPPARFTSRWTDGSMDRLVARRYAAERRFRYLGFAAVAVSGLFLAFLLVTMAWRGIGGFTATEAAVTIDFPRSDLILDPAALRRAVGYVAQEPFLTDGSVADNIAFGWPSASRAEIENAALPSHCRN